MLIFNEKTSLKMPRRKKHTARGFMPLSTRFRRSEKDEESVPFVRKAGMNDETAGQLLIGKIFARSFSR